MAAGPFIPPCIPTLVDKPPEGDAWTHEIKYDGYRTQIHLAGGSALAFTRNGIDWSKKYATPLLAARELIGRDVILDGEMVVQDERGRSDFKRLASAIRWKSAHLVFYAFDLLAVDGTDLRRWRCDDRRARLHELVGDPRPDIPIQFSQAFEGSGAQLFAAAEAMELEGVVSKRRASVYRSGDSHDWQKTKAYTVGEFVVIGFERKAGAAPSLLLAADDEGRLEYMGRAVPAVSKAVRETLWEALDFLKTDAFAAPIGTGNKGAVAVRPLLRVKAKHLRGEAKLRHASVTELIAP